MANLTEIVVYVATKFRDECFPGSWQDMPIEASWGRTSFFYYPRKALEGMKRTRIRFGSRCVEENVKDIRENRRLCIELAKMGLVESLGVSPAMMLAALICHEFAHGVVYDCTRESPQRASHGAEFYAAMRDLLVQHGTRLAHEIAALGGADLLVEPVAIRVAALRPSAPMPRISKGDNVTFSFDGRVLRGVVVESRGRGRVRVAVSNGGAPTFWKVSRPLINKIS